MRKQLLFLLFLVWTICPLFSQDSFEAYYADRLKEVRFQNDVSKFSGPTPADIPAEWQSEPVVILQKEINHDVEGRFVRRGGDQSAITHFWNMNLRQRMLVQDTAAVRQLAYYLQPAVIAERLGLSIDPDILLYYEAFVKKPAGTMWIKIGGQDSSSHKGRVSLGTVMPGDEIDLYLHIESIRDYKQPLPVLSILLADAYPVLNLKISAEMPKTYELRWKMVHSEKRPEVEEGKKFLRLNYEAQLLPKAAADWAIQPALRLAVLSAWQPNVSPGKINVGMPTEGMHNFFERTYYEYDAGMNAVGRSTISFIFQEKRLRRPDPLSQTEMVMIAYYRGRYQLLYEENTLDDYFSVGRERTAWQVNDKAFANYMVQVLKYFKIPYEVLLLKKRQDGDIADALSVDEFFVVIQAIAEGQPMLLYPPDMFGKPGYLPPEYSGTRAYKFARSAQSNIISYRTEVVMPEAEAGEHASFERFDIRYYGNSHWLLLERNRKLTGQLKTSVQKKLALFQEYAEVEWRQNFTKKNLNEYIKEEPVTRRAIFENKFKTARTEQQADVQAELAFLTDDKNITIDSFKINRYAIAIDEDTFSYRTAFRTTALTDSTSTGLAFALGRLVRDPFDRQEGGLYPRTQNVEIIFHLPPGISAENLDDFAVSVQNAAGRFSSSAVQQGKQVLIQVNLVYERLANPARLADQAALRTAVERFSKLKLFVKK